MERRRFIAAAGGVAALAGTTGVARATRADVVAEPELHRGEDEPVTAREQVRAASVSYLAETDEVRHPDGTEQFEGWARRESEAVAAERVLPAVRERLGGTASGLGRGVAYPLFGAVVTVHHGGTRTLEGGGTLEPDVPLDELVAATPRSVTVTVVLEGREATRTLPVAVEVGESPEPDRSASRGRGSGS